MRSCGRFSVLTTPRSSACTRRAYSSERSDQVPRARARQAAGRRRDRERRRRGRVAARGRPRGVRARRALRQGWQGLRRAGLKLVRAEHRDVPMTTMTTRNVLIVGSSLGGLHTAEALRSQGYDGAITMVDAEPEPRYDRPPLSKEYLSSQNASEPLGPLLRAPEALAALDADWCLGERAVSLNPRSREIGLAGGRTLRYDKLVIATGVSPVWPAALQIDGAVTLRTRQDADRLRARMAPGVRLAVIGAGFIGLEVAATF